MSSAFYQYTVTSGTFTATANPGNILGSATEQISVYNAGPEVVYAGRVLKSAPTPIVWPSNQVLPIYPGDTVALPADTGVDPWRLGFSTAFSGTTSVITVTVGD